MSNKIYVLIAVHFSSCFTSKYEDFCQSWCSTLSHTNIKPKASKEISRYKFVGKKISIISKLITNALPSLFKYLFSS